MSYVHKLDDGNIAVSVEGRAITEEEQGDDGWNDPIADKKAKAAARRERNANKPKWNLLTKQHPHIVVPEKIPRGVDGLGEKFWSKEWIDFQVEGWKFVRVVKPNDPTTALVSDPADARTYKELPVDNAWGDTCLFMRLV